MRTFIIPLYGETIQFLKSFCPWSPVSDQGTLAPTLRGVPKASSSRNRNFCIGLVTARMQLFRIVLVAAAAALIVLLPAVAATDLAEPALDESDSAPELLEIHTRNFVSAVDGGSHKGVFVIAFVHPYLRKSAYLHPILHQLNQYFQGREDVTIAYADIHRYHDFQKQFAFKHVPHLLAFSKGPNMKSAPVSIAFAENKTFTDYRREIEILANSMNGLLNVPKGVVDRVALLMDGVVHREEAERKASSSSRAASTAGSQAGVKDLPAGDASKLPASIAVTVGADLASSENATASAAAAAELLKAEVRSLKDGTESSLASIEGEIEMQLAMLEASKRKLSFLLDSVRTLESEGIGSLARAMNRVRHSMLTQASALPVDAELSSTSAAERNEQLADIAILTDLFGAARR